MGARQKTWAANKTTEGLWLQKPIRIENTNKMWRVCAFRVGKKGMCFGCGTGPETTESPPVPPR